MKKKRNIYLNMKTRNEAKKILSDEFDNFKINKKELICVTDSVGRILAEPVYSKISSPNYHAAAMDGIVVKSELTFDASETKPKKLIIGKDAFYINTGNVIPQNFDAVIMIEHVNVLEDGIVEIYAPVFPWQYVRKVGEDFVATQMIFPQNHVVTPYCVGALLTGGIFKVLVKQKPKVLIIPTGSELIDWKDLNIENIKPGDIIESNSYVLEKLIESYNAIAEHSKTISDDLELIKNKVEQAIEDNYDLILILGGSSAGSEDYAKDVIKSLGKVLVHGVTIMPGKPIIMGSINKKPVFGIPGYPVSAIIAFEQFVKPLISRLSGFETTDLSEISVKLTRKVTSKLGVEEFLRVKLGKVGDKIMATPLGRGAGSISTITQADGFIRIGSNLEGLKETDDVKADLIRPISTINNTVVIVGSHDNTIDVLADQVRADKNIIISSSNVGSMGGLMAIKKGVSHMAGTHLLDENDGTYNVSYIKKLLPELKLKLINLVYREQGLIVKPNNPKQILQIKDLIRDDITFINRQYGSGTRILLDYKLKELNINSSQINGYENDEFNHMSVAVAVSSGTADVGLGIYAAAKALNLDFVPIVTEQYDLVVCEKFYHTKKIQSVLTTIKSSEFKKRVENLGGYSTKDTGKIIWEN